MFDRPQPIWLTHSADPPRRINTIGNELLGRSFWRTVTAIESRPLVSSPGMSCYYRPHYLRLVLIQSQRRLASYQREPDQRVRRTRVLSVMSHELIFCLFPESCCRIANAICYINLVVLRTINIKVDKCSINASEIMDKLYLNCTGCPKNGSIFARLNFTKY